MVILPVIKILRVLSKKKKAKSDFNTISKLIMGLGSQKRFDLFSKFGHYSLLIVKFFYGKKSRNFQLWKIWKLSVERVFL